MTITMSPAGRLDDQADAEPGWCMRREDDPEFVLMARTLRN
jgi:hypothetical protein